MSDQEREIVTRIYANVGKAIAAYERRILPGPSRFDAYVEAVIKGDAAGMEATLTPDEVAGLRLFIGEANCLQCHNGSLFTDNHFHNTGVPAAPDLPEDSGRLLGAQQVLTDEFNCLSPYSDAGSDDCSELRFMVAQGHELERQFKAPSLRNVTERAPFMHAGQFDTLHAVLEHYNRAPEGPHRPFGTGTAHPLGERTEPTRSLPAHPQRAAGHALALQRLKVFLQDRRVNISVFRSGEPSCSG